MFSHFLYLIEFILYFIFDVSFNLWIQNAKGWVVGQVNAASSQSVTALRETCTFVCTYLEHRSMGFAQPDDTMGVSLGFQQRLHIAYLLNDLLHHWYN